MYEYHGMSHVDSMLTTVKNYMFDTHSTDYGHRNEIIKNLAIHNWEDSEITAQISTPFFR